MGDHGHLSKGYNTPRAINSKGFPLCKQRKML